MSIASILAGSPIVVTGLGAFTSAGTGVEALWTAARAGMAQGEWLPPRMQSGGVRVPGCPAPATPLTLEFVRIRRMDRSVHLGLAAALEAWKDAGLDRQPWDPERVGVIAGTSRGPVEKWSESMDRLAKGRVLPTMAANSTIANLSGALSMVFEARGPSLTVSSACSSSASAIIIGAQQILTGAADVILVGGAEAPLNANVLAQLAAAGVLGSHDDPRRTCRPFDVSRNGTILGEGAAFLVLESLATARQRGARVHASLAGWAMGSEGSERTGMSENGEGLHRVMAQALHRSNLSPSSIQYVNAHGTGTRLNDQMEARALAQLFTHAGPIACSSTKPVTGHCMGAAAAIEAVISVQALARQCAPPTPNCEGPENSPALDLIREHARACKISAVMSNSSGFWGNHASLIFSRGT